MLVIPLDRNVKMRRKSTRRCCSRPLILAAFVVALAAGAGDAGPVRASQPVRKPQTGPGTEKRFPPLKVPKGFRATLFACDPLVEYPSVIALGPKPGTLFVAHDYMTGLGTAIVRRDEVRLLRDAEGDGYADTSTVYAGGFNSIQGLAYHDGSVFVMHAPYLTALKDTDGDGVADLRRDIVKGLGLPPEKNPNRLHSANGVVAGHDGWLYLAVGDRGCDVKRPEGDRLLFQQGGILRCRPDGSDLHVFAGGLRNIYDVALDAELNVFVRDNENDGGDYMIRVCRSFFGADHGYPYLYAERPDEALRPLADLGRGSSAGGTAYLEAAFPKPYRQSLFFCEWGRAVVRYRLSRAGSGFASPHEVDFAAAAPDDPYGLKPTDLVVDYDGSLLIADWGDGQRPKRGRGRIYRITYTGNRTKSPPQPHVSAKTDLRTLLKTLNTQSHHTRVVAQLEIERRGGAALPALRRALTKRTLNPLGRMHAVWILARGGGPNTLEELFRVAETDAETRVRAQAVRALADLTDPVLTRHQVTTGRGDEKVALHLAEFASKERDPRVVLEVIVALGRLRWRDAPNWLRKHWHVFKTGDALEHAAMQLLRRSDNWPAVFKLLDHSAKGGSKRVGLRAIALRALAGRSDPIVVDGLIRRFETETTAARRRDYVDALTRVYKKPAPWTYWGFRPAPRPANSVAWKRTETIGKTLDRALADPDVAVRATALKRMQREMVPIRPATLDRWLRTETDATRLRAILVALKGFPPSDVRGSLERIVRDRKRAVSNRLAALATFAGGLDKDAADRLLAAAKTLEDGPVLAAALRAMERRTSISSDRFLLAKLGSRNAAVRAAAIEMLARRRVAAASGRVVGLLSDPDVRVRRAASFAAGTLRVSQGVDRLRALAGGDDRESCRLSLESLNSLRDSRAVPQAVAALKHPQTQLAALEYLEAFGGSKQAGHLTRLADSARSSDVMIGIARALSKWSSVLPPQSRTRRQLERAVATVHRKSGVLLHWSVIGPLSAEKADRVAKQLATVLPGDPIVSPKKWRSHIAVGTDAAIRLPAGAKASAGSSWLAVSHLYSETPAKVEFLTSSSGTMRIRLNGRQVFRKSKPGAYRADAERFDASLVKGNNRLLVRIDGPSRGTTFHLRFRTKSSKAEHERLVQLALRGRGSALRGREVFRDAKKANCLNCHRLGAAGGNIGPDLTGVGRRFSKIHIVEAILEPSRTIAPSYATVSVALSSGRVLSGVRIAETTTQLTLGDNQGKIHTIAKSDIERTRVQSKSTMPEGIEKQLTDRQFLDLIAFLQSQKKRLSKR